MIKNIQVELDGFKYNILQMSGEQAFKMQIKLLNVLSGFKLDSLHEKTEGEMLLSIVRGLLSAANVDVLFPIVKELLSTSAFIEVNKSLAESEGYSPDRHFSKSVSLDQFVGKDMAHLYQLLFEILKANYADFFMQARGWLGSRLAGKTVESRGIKPA